MSLPQKLLKITGSRVSDMPFYPVYNFSTTEIGLCYISNCLGYAIGSVVGGKLSDEKLRHYQLTHGGEFRPVERIKTV